MDEVHLDWSTAEVADRTLTVRLAGDPPRGWKAHARTTVGLLGPGEWGRIRVKKGSVSVEDVPAGCEERLRHRLESIVQQANVAAAAEELARAGERRSGPDRDPGDPDVVMQRRFRSYGEAPSTAGH